jgi:hypothetical protein
MVLKLAALLIALTFGAPPFAHAAAAILSASDFGGHYTSGTVRIRAVQSDGSPTGTALAPGAPMVETVVVTNEGSLELRYAVTAETAGLPLAGELTVTVWNLVTKQDAGAACGTQSPASILFGPATLGSAKTVRVIGDPAQGAQVGDRTLTSGASETLCIQMIAPLRADGWSGSTPVFNLDAEQTDNNN